MSAQAITAPTKFQRRLMWAQDHRCFHCGNTMAFRILPGTPRSEGVTREHVFPHATTGKGLVNNIVLAHAVCNYQRGDRQPTPAEIAKAARIYLKMGMAAFVPAGTPTGREILDRMTLPKVPPAQILKEAE